MFYLLEDNRIVDRLSIREDLDLPFEVDFYVQKDEIVLTIDHNYFYHIRIIKKAENVYGLIEVGDLVKYERYDDRIYIEEVFGIIRTGKFIEVETTTAFAGEENFLAIYKQDANGNYIKVWEKKEDKKS